MALAQVASNLSEYPPLEAIDDIPTQQQQRQQQHDPSGSSLVNDDDEWGDGGSFDFDEPTDFSIFTAADMMSSSIPTKPFSISPLADEDDDEEEEEDDDDDEGEEELDYDDEDSIPRSLPTAPPAASEKRPDTMRLYEQAVQQVGYSLSLDGGDTEQSP